MKYCFNRILLAITLACSFAHTLWSQGGICGSSQLYVTGTNVVAISTTSFNAEAAGYYNSNQCEVFAATLTWNNGNNAKTFSDGNYSSSYTNYQTYDPSQSYRLDSTHSVIFKAEYTSGGFSYFLDPWDLKYSYEKNTRGDAGGRFDASHIWCGAKSLNQALHFSTNGAIKSWRTMIGKTYKVLERSNRPPVFDPNTISGMEVAIGGPTYLQGSYQFQAVDPDGDPVSYSCQINKGSFVGKVSITDSGYFTWCPDLTRVVTADVIISAKDGKGGEANWPLTLVTRRVTRPPKKGEDPEMPSLEKDIEDPEMRYHEEFN